MKPADDPDTDYKALVQQGYDQCAAAYENARRSESNPELDLLMEQLSPGARVLDVGCGAGVPVAQRLAEQFHVTGVDISGEQVRRARLNVPTGEFIQGDILSMDFPPAHFDAATAFYSIFHLPREEHPELLRRIRGWLKPGGYLLATLSARSEDAYTEDDFFDVTMYWSNYGLDEYQSMLTQLGFTLLETTVIGHGYTEEAQAEHHPLVLAQAAE
ncbi:MAG: class I SAM-dependent methyltransferase [Chloroflexi bacterium]|nr:class I SAM-dependent methyltransferase [Chloroflexota bacterium]